jgi:L-lactate dehydrogenase complex protein LldF
MTGRRNILDFRTNAAQALSDGALRAAMKNATDTASAKRIEAFSAVPDVNELRNRAGAIRSEVLADIDRYVDQFILNAEASGATVHQAANARSAQDIVVGLLNRGNVRRVVKSKSMISEEIHLNARLEHEGITVIETDLGEYIIQMAGETPSHITAPAIHKTRQQVGELFAEKLGCQYTDDPYKLTKVARETLRREFLGAGAGITGANFAVAETGSIVLFTNEGNGRMVTGFPPLHIAVFSIEKIIPQLTDLAIFSQLLPRSATGQTMTSYLTVLSGTRKPDEVIGPDEVHIVLLDNGRRRILQSECRDILKCIRCGACLNVCPVYRVVGGHSYGSTYSGPMGIVLTTLLEGMDRAGPLLDATTLCGACADACPVKVPLKDLLTTLRSTRAQKGLCGLAERSAMAAFGTVASSPFLYDLSQRLLPPLWGILSRVGGSTIINRLPQPAKYPFRKRSAQIFAQRNGLERKSGPKAGERKSDRSELTPANEKFSHRPETALPAKRHRSDVEPYDPVSLFLENAGKAGAKTIRLAGIEQVEELVRELSTEPGNFFCSRLTDNERAVRIPEERTTQDYSLAAIAIEEVSGAIAESGTIICSASGGRALQANMLPEHHVALVSKEKIFPTIEAFLASTDTLPSTLTFITGPSRTADIEKKLVIGVHGPERLTVAVF